MDALSLPTLAVVVVIFLIYIGFAWVRPKGRRAIVIPDETEDETPVSDNHR